MDFFYDASGYPFAVKYNGDLCYYITNLQGDVMSIVDAQGEVVAEYEYDPYGNILTATGPLADVNPLRYRGYVYDNETQFYYLQSRYYDPEIARFINADAYVSTGQGVLGNNMFAYCHNNPIVFVDASGYVIELATDANEEQKEEFERAVAYLKTSKTGRELIELLENSDIVFTIAFIDNDEMCFDPSDKTIYFDTNSGLVIRNDSSVQSAALGLAHEMGHAAQYLTGKYIGSIADVEAHNLSTYETPIANELGEPTRSHVEDYWGFMDMQNPTHFITPKVASRPLWHYFLIIPLLFSYEQPVHHNIDT